MQYICLVSMSLKKKKILKKKSVKKNKASTDKNILDEIIRVDHAGEYGATRIYDGQIAVFGKNSKIGKTIKHMADQEQEHIEKFNELIIEKRVRPTALLPLWNVAGFALGAGTALMGEKAAMACTVAVEKVIGEHYKEQQNLLEEDEKELKKTIDKFEKDKERVFCNNFRPFFKLQVVQADTTFFQVVLPCKHLGTK